MVSDAISDVQYAKAVGCLLMLYTQVNRLLMAACAERIPLAPDMAAKMGLAKQVGDKCLHLTIQCRWMDERGVDPTPLVSAEAVEELRTHFHGLDWVDFLTDVYLVKAMGCHAVEQVMPLTDTGTRESLRIPLRDELDHVAFGLAELRKALAAMGEAERQSRMQAIPARIDAMIDRLAALALPFGEWLDHVGSSHDALRSLLDRRKQELMLQLAA